MFKNPLVPIQAWLLSQGRCPGCGVPLKKGKEKVACKCGRVLIYSQKTKKYRPTLWGKIIQK